MVAFNAETSNRIHQNGGIFLNSSTQEIHKVATFSALAILVLLCMVQPSFATISRVNSFGGSGDYFEDDSNVLRWYGSLVDYPDQVIVESGDFTILDGYWRSVHEKQGGMGIGAHMALGREGQFGTAAFFFHDQDEDRISTLQEDNLRNNFSFLYSLDLGPLTAGVTYRHGSLKTEVYDSTTDLSIDTFGTGLRMDLGESAYLDLAGEVCSIKEIRNWDPDPQEDNADGLYALRGRAFVALGPRMALVPLVEIIHEDRRGGYHTKFISNNRLQRFGLGLNYFPDTDHLLFFNAEYSDYSEANHFSSVSVTHDWSTMILNMGFESRMLSWLTTRGSVGYVDYNRVTTIDPLSTPPDEIGFEGPILRVNLGAGIHLGPADLDFSFWEKVPHGYSLVRDMVKNERWLSITARFLF